MKPHWNSIDIKYTFFICMLSMFLLSVNSCSDMVKLSPQISPNCNISYKDDAIEISIGNDNCTLVRSNDGFVLSNSDVLVLSNSFLGKMNTKTCSVFISKLSSNMFSSKILSDDGVIIFYYNSDYKIKRILKNGYIQFGEVPSEPLHMKVDSICGLRTYFVD